MFQKQTALRRRGLLVTALGQTSQTSQITIAPKIFCKIQTNCAPRKHPLHFPTMTTNLCKCLAPRRPNQNNCLACHAYSMRKYRKDNPLSEQQRAKGTCRSYAQVYLKRGKIQRLPCVSCASLAAQMHHADYTKPLAIVWMCRACWGKVRKESLVRKRVDTEIPQKDPFACISR